MAQITINIPDVVLQRVVSGFCKAHGYQETVIINLESKPNPETKGEFARRKIREFIKESVARAEAEAAAVTAAQAAAADADALSIT